MFSNRQTWLGSLELPFQTWNVPTRLAPSNPSYLPNDTPSIVGFRVYTLNEASGPQFENYYQSGSKNSIYFESEENEEPSNSDEVIVSEKQLEEAASSIIFAAASSGGQHVVIRKEDIIPFLNIHKECIFVCLNAAMDYMIVRQLMINEGAEEALDSWNELVDECRLRDLFVLDGLVRLGVEDGCTIARTVQEIAQEHLKFEISSTALSRKLSPSISSHYHSEYIEYHEDTIAGQAINDVVILQACYLRLLAIALRVSFEHRQEMYGTAVSLYGPLSEGIQVKGSIALFDITKNGISVDKELLGKIQQKLEDKLTQNVTILTNMEHARRMFDLVVGENGSLVPSREGGRPKIDQSKLDELLNEAVEEISSKFGMDLVIPRIAGGNYTRAPKTWMEYSQFSPFIQAWVEMSQAVHFKTFLSHLKEDRAHPQYAIMVRNGRTSAQNPPIQQTPRKGGFREMFRASPGHVLITVDYNFIELCTLAAVCLHRYGNSVLAKVIVQGVDPHAFTASMIEGIPLHAFMAWKTSPDPVLRAKYPLLRQRAKAINFGIPSGLTAPGLAAYAKVAYGVELSADEAEKFRNTLIHDIYPELSKYLEDGDMDRLAANLKVSLQTVTNVFTFSKGSTQSSKLREAIAKNGSNNEDSENAAQQKKLETIEGGIRNIVRGQKYRKRDGKEYSPFFVKKVWSGLKRLVRDPELFKKVDAASKDSQGSEEIYKELFGRPVVTLTGRVRGKVGFTQACNTPFSGLAADGAKLAMWNLFQMGYKLVGFIHDEMIIEVPETEDGTYDEVAEEIKHIMTGSMAELTGPIPIGCELSVSQVWSKDAHPTYNESGQLIVWKPMSSEHTAVVH